MKDIWEVALTMEIKSRDFYGHMAEISTSDELIGLFLFLRDQEQDHFDAFLAFKKNVPPQRKNHEYSRKIADDLFTKISAQFDMKSFKQDSLSVYKSALSMETNAIKVYSDLLKNCNDPEQHTVLNQIIEEEQKHESIILSIINYIEKYNETTLL